ncbi:MAG: neutral/alkaline non-lysosomal ceramidase N-terminal domain-containing protein, partial [Lentisphaeria bacterium]|nr:neutral/alkaline non-lysosomal ceramidase N-terminal domain-containing protein [Lentisphaeria bacterium]
MQKTFECSSANCQAGIARRDITPPVGIYNRCWGAALYDTATGVHHPFTATALAMSDFNGGSPLVILTLDLCWFEYEENEEFLSTVTEQTGIGRDQLIVSLGHSHAGCNLSANIKDKEGGEMIGPFFEHVIAQSIDAIKEAMGSQEDVWFTADYGNCNLATNRNYNDTEFGEMICGFNPEGSVDNTLALVRITNSSGEIVAHIINYGCHPTTLGPENRLLSPDYISAARGIMERDFGGLCMFMISPCGDTGPREGFVA